MNAELAVAVEAMNDAVQDTHASGRPAGHLESAWDQLAALLRSQRYVNREGWQLVPVTPTPAMCDAFTGVSMDMSVTPNQFKDCYYNERTPEQCVDGLARQARECLGEFTPALPADTLPAPRRRGFWSWLRRAERTIKLKNAP